MNDSIFYTQQTSDFSKQKSQFDSVNKYKGYLIDEVNKFNGDIARIKLMFADYNAAIKDEKQALQYQDRVGGYLLQLDSIANMVQTAIISLSTQVRNKMYPLATDTKAIAASNWSSTGTTVAQLVIANAISIFNLSVNDVSIRTAFIYNVDKYIATGQFDFYSTLLELELNRADKTADEAQNILDLKKQYYQFLKITPMLAESLELSRLLDDIQWQRAIQSVTSGGSTDLLSAVGGMMKDRQLSAALAELQ